jgi:hypothetical protein
MDQTIIQKYSLPLKHAFDYIGKISPKATRKQWSPEQREKWKFRYKDCPICKEKWTKGNPMTKEHIHPLVLGGYERDENIIPLCEKCNSARNKVMSDVLGSRKIITIRKRMPAIKVAVQEFVIWSHASINSDEEALRQCQDLSEAFAKKRKIENPYDNSKNQPLRNNKKSLMARIKQPFNSLIDKLSYPNELEKLVEGHLAKEKNTIAEEAPENALGAKKSRRPKQETKTNVKDWSELDTSNKDDLENLLISLIGEDSVNVAALGRWISAYQKNNGLQDTGSKFLLKEFGLRGSLNQVIIREFSDNISVEATAFRTDPDTKEEIPTSFKYSVKRTVRPDSLSNDVDQVKFINAIEELLSGDDKTSVMVIGNRIRKMQEVNEWKELGTRSFLQHYGFSRNFGLLNALKLCFRNQIKIEGDRNSQRIKFAGKKNKLSLETELNHLDTM